MIFQSNLDLSDPIEAKFVIILQGHLLYSFILESSNKQDWKAFQCPCSINDKSNRILRIEKIQQHM